MTTAQDIIRQVSATGARFVLVAGGVGFDRPLPGDLLELAREHKAAIQQELEQQATADYWKATDERVTCTNCQQTTCQYPLRYGRHNSTQPRWCANYTPLEEETQHD